MFNASLYNVSAQLKRLTTALFVVFCMNSYGQVYPTMGTEFWLGFLENYQVSANDRLDIFITSDVNTAGTISIPQQGYTQNFTVTANVTTTVNIPNAIAEHYGGGFVDNRGILIETNDTCAVFAINFDNYTADATKVLPTVSLATDYLVNTIYPLNGYHSEFLVVATEDGTEVEITVPVPVTSGQPVGVPFTVQLDRGESYQLQADGAGDLSGSTVVGTAASGDCRPFAVFSGTRCTNIPSGCYACDHTFDQNFPTYSWGSEYYVVPISFATRYTYRVMALSNGTSYTIDGGAPINLNAGQFNEYNAVTAPRCIQSNQPIAVTQYLEGTSCAGTGDPAQMALNASDQMVNHVTLSTVQSTVINQHGLNIVMETPYTNTLSLDGVPVSAAQFTSFPSCPGYSYAQITIAQGSHTLDSPNGFSAYVYGTGSAESYAYSAGSFSNDPIPPVDTVVCASDTVILNAPPGLFNPWWATQTNPNDTLGTGTSLTLNPPFATDIYIVTGDALLSGCEEFYTYSVEYQAPPIYDIMANGIFTDTVTVCAYEQVQLEMVLNPAGTFFYDWYPPFEMNSGTIANPLLTPSQSGWYVCDVQSLTGCVTFSDSIYVNVQGGDVLNIDAITGNGTNEDTLCNGDDSQLDVAMERITWRDNFDALNPGNWASLQNGIQSNLCGSLSGDALYFDGAGVRSAETIGIDVSTGGTIQFMLKIANGAAPCENADPGENVVLEYSAMGGPWTLINTYFENLYPNFTLINLPIPAGAISTNTQFRWRQVANSGAGEDNWALDNINIATLDNSGYVYAWTPALGLNDPAIPNPIATPTTTTTYVVDVIDTIAGCNYIDSVVIHAEPLWTLDMPNDTILCDVAGVQLNANPTAGNGHTFAWTPNNGTLSDPAIQDPVATPNVTTTYYVTATSNLGCTVMDSINITVAALNSVTASTNNNNFCQGQSAVLDATVLVNPNNFTYVWTPALDLDDNTLQNPTATPSDTVMYVVTATDTTSGCIVIDSVQINVIPSFPVTAMNDTTVCQSVGLPLTTTHGAVGAVTYDWQPAALLDDNTLASPTIMVDTDTTYYVTVTNNQGCSNIDSVNVTVLFTTLSLGPDTMLCQGQTVTLDGGNGISYQWSSSPNDTLQTLTVGASGTYWVDVYDNNGCLAQDTIDIVVNPLPVVDIGPDTSLCDGLTLDLDAGNPGMTFDWSTTETTQTITVNTTNNYSVSVTDGNGCINTDDINVTFTPLAVVDLGADTLLCQGETLTLDAGAGVGYTYQWSTSPNDTLQTYDVNVSGTFGVDVYTAEGCLTQDTITVVVVPLPVVDLGPDTALCDGLSVDLDAGAGAGYTYAWSTTEATQGITVTTTNNYSVTVTNPNGCFSSDDINVTFNPLPVVDLGVDQTVCETPAITLDAGNAGSTFTWSTAETTQSIIPTNTATYWVEVINQFNCSASDTVDITIITHPIVDLGPDSALCVGESMMLVAGNPTFSSTWSNGATTDTVVVTTTDTYTVSVTNGYCTTLDNVDIVFNPLPVALPYNDTTFCNWDIPGVAVLDAGNLGSTYQWSTGETSQQITVNSDETFYVTITTEHNCVGYDSVEVNIYCEPTIYVPNSFTPNGDGRNDFFYAQGEGIVEFEMLIFDRWGQLLFQTDQINLGWGGVYNNEPVQQDVYVWKIRYRYEQWYQGPLSSTKELVGHVTLLR